jgi:hypothetical protein
MREEIEILELVTKRLEENNVAYMISGSMALNFYGQPRMTRDIDVVIELTISDVDKICDAFKNDFYVDKKMIKDAFTSVGMFNIIHLEKMIKIDFIIKKTSDYRIEEFNRKKYVKFNHFYLYIVSPEDLILSKLFWAKDSHSEMQLKDIKNVLDNVRELDFDYLKMWAKNLDVDKLLDEVSGI